MPAEVVPPKRGAKMAAFTMVTVSARYERAADETIVKVAASGEEGHGGIELVELDARPGCYHDGQVLCVEVVFDPYKGGDTRWSKSKRFKRSAEYVVLLHKLNSELRVLTARPVEKVDGENPETLSVMQRIADMLSTAKQKSRPKRPRARVRRLGT
jgi:hypothetical protein